MKKIFVSQPMSGKSVEDMKHVCEIAVKELCQIFNEEVEVINSIFEVVPKGSNSIWFLGESIKLLSEADLVYFTKGWESYRGCKIEHTVCTEYGIKTLYQQKWMSDPTDSECL